MNLLSYGTSPMKCGQENQMQPLWCIHTTFPVPGCDSRLARQPQHGRSLTRVGRSSSHLIVRQSIRGWLPALLEPGGGMTRQPVSTLLVLEMEPGPHVTQSARVIFHLSNATAI